MRGHGLNGQRSEWLEDYCFWQSPTRRYCDKLQFQESGQHRRQSQVFNRLTMTGFMDHWSFRDLLLPITASFIIPDIIIWRRSYIFHCTKMLHFPIIMASAGGSREMKLIKNDTIVALICVHIRILYMIDLHFWKIDKLTHADCIILNSLHKHFPPTFYLLYSATQTFSTTIRVAVAVATLLSSKWRSCGSGC